MLSLLAAAALMTGGDLTFYPSNSIDAAAIVVHTSAGCPSAADSYYALATGHGFPKDGLVVTAPTSAGMSRTEGFDVFFAQTMKDFAADNGTTLQGRYDIAVYCADSFTGERYAQFTGRMTFSSPTKYRASGPDTGAKNRAVAPVATVAPAQQSPAAQSPAAEPTTTVAAAPAPKDGGPPIGWIAGGVAVLLLTLELGRRLGRRSATTRP